MIEKGVYFGKVDDDVITFEVVRVYKKCIKVKDFEFDNEFHDTLFVKNECIFIRRLKETPFSFDTEIQLISCDEYLSVKAVKDIEKKKKLFKDLERDILILEFELFCKRKQLESLKGELNENQ